MIRNFFARGTEDIYNGVDSRVARKTLPSDLWAVAVRKLDQLNTAITLESLRRPPGNRLEALRRGRKGQHAIRINDLYRVSFVWTADGPTRVEITD